MQVEKIAGVDDGGNGFPAGMEHIPKQGGINAFPDACLLRGCVLLIVLKNRCARRKIIGAVSCQRRAVTAVSVHFPGHGQGNGLGQGCFSRRIPAKEQTDRFGQLQLQVFKTLEVLECDAFYLHGSLLMKMVNGQGWSFDMQTTLPRLLKHAKCFRRWLNVCRNYRNRRHGLRQLPTGQQFLELLQFASPSNPEACPAL